MNLLQRRLKQKPSIPVAPVFAGNSLSGYATARLLELRSLAARAKGAPAKNANSFEDEHTSGACRQQWRRGYLRHNFFVHSGSR
jgi:hypothetical protein